MPKVHVAQSKLVGAPPAKVYRVLIDTEHHRHILPDSFISYQPEAGDVVAFSIKAGGSVRSFRVKVEQTEPDSVLSERDVATGIVTQFLLEPHPDGTVVTIKTEYETPASLSGYLEAFFSPIFLRNLYEEELTKLGRYILVVGD